MIDVISPMAVALVGAILVWRTLQAYEVSERGLIALSFLAHATAALLQVWITLAVYGSGDATNYFRHGSRIVDVVSYDPGRFLPELLKMFLQQPNDWPVYVLNFGSTGSMTAICGALQLVLGKSIYGVGMFLSFAAGFGQLALYRVFRDLFARELRTRLMLATLLVPSVVFWSSTILKETVAIAGFGWVVLGLHRFVQGRTRVGLLLVIAGGFFVGLTKAYILFATAAAAAVWWYWRRALDGSGGRAVTIRPLYFVLGSAGLVALVVGLGAIFPRFAFDRFGEEAARLQQVGQYVSGGSNIEVVDTPQRSLLGQLGFAPLALLTALFRPVVFEVTNAVMAVNALETTLLTVLFVRGLLRRSPAAILDQIRRSPTLVFSVVFILLFGIAVGLATTNLGTLSRYRIPLVPFFAALVLLWNAPSPRVSQPQPPVRRPARAPASRPLET